MKKYKGDIMFCRSVSDYEKGEENHLVVTDKIGRSIECGYYVKNITIREKGASLLEVSPGVFVKKENYPKYLSPQYSHINYELTTKPEEDYSSFIDPNSLKKRKVLSLFK